MPGGGAAGVDARTVVREEIGRLLDELGRTLPRPPSDQDRLDADLGLSSLEVTTVLSRLAGRLELKGAERLMASTDLATVGDVSRAFLAATGGSAPTGPPDPLEASRRRAAARRSLSSPS